jgi:uncharacterized protein (TIGR00725 family)
MRKLRIGVIGPSEATAELCSLAEDVGRLIAEAGAILISGGGAGVMEAASKGAKSAGGITVGILPGTNENEANEYVDIPIMTGMGHGRNIINVWSSDAIIAIGGGYGTLSEIALALRTNKPVIGLSTWDFSVQGARELAHYLKVRTAKEAISAALELAAQKGTMAEKNKAA